MKKSFIALGLAVAAFSFTGCNKVEPTDNNQNIKGGQHFEIVANASATKTENDGLDTKWSANDALTVFHAVSGSTSYGSNDQFTIAEDDVESGTFKGTLTEALDSDKSYDWYAIYPYNVKYTTPANTTCYQQIANKQTQVGYGSTAHLAGNKFPLVGKVKSVAGNAKPNITMNQVCAVIKLEVTNNSGEDLTITSASVTSENVNLAGGYFIDFSGDKAVLVDENEGNSEYDKYMFKTVNLTVNNGDVIADGETASLYIGVKPFVANDEIITISVNGYEKPLEIPAHDVKFEAGKIKKVAFSYDNTAEEEDFSGEWLITGMNKDDIYAMGKYDGKNNIPAISSPLSFNDDGKVMETSEIAAGKVSIAKISEGEYKGMYTIQDASGNYLYAAGGNTSNYMKAHQTLDNASYWTIAYNNSEYSIIASKYSGTRNILRFNYNGGSPLFSCYSSGQSPISLFPYSNVIPDTATSIQGITDPETVSATGGEVTVTYTIKNPIEGNTISAEASEDWVNTFDYSVDGEISFVVDANTGAARTCTVTVSYEGAKDVSFEVSQAAGNAGSEEEFTIKSGDVVTNSGYAVYTTTVDERNWVVTFGGNNKSVGTNSGNRSKCTLKDYSKYAVSPVTTSDIASAFACTTKLSGVKKISYTVGGGSNQSNTNVYVLYSADGNTFSQISLISGTQGAALSSGTSFEFASCDGFFAVLFKATNSSGNWRIDDVNLTFTYEVN